MPTKKTKGSKTEPKPRAADKLPDKETSKEEVGDFLVLSCITENIRSGAKLTLVKVAETKEGAVSYVKSLTGQRPEYLCIVEKKAMFSRKPQIVVSELAPK